MDIVTYFKERVSDVKTVVIDQDINSIGYLRPGCGLRYCLNKVLELKEGDHILINMCFISFHALRKHAHVIYRIFFFFLF